MADDADASRILLFGVATIVALAGVAVVLATHDRVAPRPPERPVAPPERSLPATTLPTPPSTTRSTAEALRDLLAPEPAVGPPPAVGALPVAPSRAPAVPPTAAPPRPAASPPVSAPVPSPPPAPSPPVGSPPAGATPPVPPSEGAATLVLQGGNPEIVAEVAALLRERAGGAGPLRAPDGRVVRVEGEAGAAAEPRGPVAAVAALEGEAIRLLSAPPAEPPDDPVDALVPPTGLVGPSLEGIRLVTGPGGRAPGSGALACLLAGDARSADGLLDASIPTPGLRILRGWARLLRGDLPAVHASVKGLFDDPDVAPVARLLSAAALRADGSALEATRDLEAARALRPDWVPALLLVAEAYESPEVRLMDQAAAAWAAAHAAAPRDVTAAVGHAYHLAATEGDRAASRKVLDDLLASRPDSVAGLRLLAWWHARGDDPDGPRAALAALERVAALRPQDARSWSDAGSARWALAERGGGASAVEGALEAYARATTIAPEDPGTWARRGSALHQAALDPTARDDAATYRKRLHQARVCYGRALALGVAGAEAARVRFNLGLMADLLPPDAPVPEGALSARAAYAAALDLDPDYVEAGTALVAAHVAARDAAGASAALARLPAGTEPAERGVLEAAAAFLAGDAARARERLAGPGGVPVAGEDPRAALARALLVLGHRRAAVAVAGDDATDAASWAVRARAHAGLREAEETRRALARLEALDRAEADRLRAEDPDVRRAVK